MGGFNWWLVLIIGNYMWWANISSKQGRLMLAPKLVVVNAIDDDSYDQIDDDCQADLMNLLEWWWQTSGDDHWYLTDDDDDEREGSDWWWRWQPP